MGNHNPDVAFFISLFLILLIVCSPFIVIKYLFKWLYPAKQPTIFATVLLLIFSIGVLTTFGLVLNSDRKIPLLPWFAFCLFIVIQTSIFIVKNSITLENDGRPVSLWGRLLNFIIDIVVTMTLISLPLYVLLAFAPDFQTGYIKFDQNFKLIFIFTMFSYYFIFELFTKRTIGKLFSYTKVADQYGYKPTFEHIFSRTMCRFLPLYDQVSFFGVKGFHDSFSKTIVIKNNTPYLIQNENQVNSAHLNLQNIKNRNGFMFVLASLTVIILEVLLAVIIFFWL